VSHLGKYTEKYAIIEAIDRILISRLSKSLEIDSGDTLVMTCDHSTSSELRRHINSNIPVLIVNRKFGRNNDFGESACKKNHIKQIKKATDIMPFVNKL
jgi:2,3-bisphosphoglycerate-independent phosphoglycerate mutase